MYELINSRKPGDTMFTARFEEIVVNLYAKNVASARQRAIEHFRPKRKQLHNIWVEHAGE